VIRFRQSVLEQFRRVCQTDYAHDEDLVAQLNGVNEPSARMKAGTAWHAALEDRAACATCLSYGVGMMEVQGYLFSTPDVAEAQNAVGAGSHEVPGSLLLSIDGVDVEITGTADHVEGIVVTDHKTVFDTPDPADYEDSLQWRLYLLLFDCDVFRYMLWHFKEPADDGVMELKSLTTVRFWKYPEMEQDVRRWASRFIEWCRTRKLMHRLEVQDAVPTQAPRASA
jgi:hypothetical protein